MIKLIIEDDEGKTTVVPLIRDEITIGRKEGNTIRLTERNVSRRHAKLVKQNGAVFIEDLSSYNGIKVNGNRINGKVAVTEGDRIQIGDYVLGLKMEGLLETASSAAKTVELPQSAPPDEAQTTQLEVGEVEAETPTAITETYQNVGRMVCVSTNFPGQEWLLNKPLMVLGRTEDNDVVINHRSISRHHARVTEEHGRYTIIDLQSSNGVRVNGEEYGKVELRRGDLVDLGHVRLRFVAPGEDFVFSRDASVVDISKTGASSGSLWAALSVFLVLVVGGLVWYFYRSASPTAAASVDAQLIATADTRRSSAIPEADPAQLLLEAMRSEDWVAALKHCSQMTPEQQSKASEDCAKAEREKLAREDFEKAHTATRLNKYLEAMSHWSRIPEESVYKSRDRETFDRSRDKFLAQARIALEEMVRARECERARAQVETMKRVAPEDREPDRILARCAPVEVAAKVKLPLKVAVKKAAPIPSKKVEPVQPQPQPKETVDPAQLKALLEAARQSYIHGQHSQAITQIRQVLRLTPNNIEAVQILGASSCYQQNRTQALWAFDRLPPKNRNLLKSLCERLGITLP